MSLEGWIFMVGLRVFDVGALVVWLVWFFRLRDDDDDDGDDDGRREKATEASPKSPWPRWPEAAAAGVPALAFASP